MYNYHISYHLCIALYILYIYTPNIRFHTIYRLHHDMYIPYIHISSLSHINHDTSYIIESYTYIISYICVYIYIHTYHIYIYTYTYHTMWLPPVISWLTKAPVTSSCTHQVLPGESHRSFGPDQGHRSSPVGVGWCRMGGTVGPGYWWFFMLAMDYIYDMCIYIYMIMIYMIYMIIFMIFIYWIFLIVIKDDYVAMDQYHTCHF